LYYFSAAAANLSAIITIKNELLKNKLEKEAAEKTKEIMEQIEELARIRQRKEEELREWYLLQADKNKYMAHHLRLDELGKGLDVELLSYKEKLASGNASPSELMVKCENIRRNISKYEEEHNSLASILSRNGIELPLKTEIPGTDTLEETIIHKSSIFNLNFDFDYYFSIEWFEKLGGVQQLAVGILLGKSVILSSLISIIFIFYGDILLDKYNIANKYPKLAKIIELRKKYQRYYFKYNCLLIFMVIISEFMVGLALLAITF